jgi:hypothetical protein
MLLGPCAALEKVALDPLPEILAERVVGLVNLRRDRFLDLLDKNPIGTQATSWTKKLDTYSRSKTAREDARETPLRPAVVCRESVG